MSHTYKTLARVNNFIIHKQVYIPDPMSRNIFGLQFSLCKTHHNKWWYSMHSQAAVLCSR